MSLCPWRRLSPHPRRPLCLPVISSVPQLPYLTYFTTPLCPRFVAGAVRTLILTGTVAAHTPLYGWSHDIEHLHRDEVQGGAASVRGCLRPGRGPGFGEARAKHPKVAAPI